MFIQLFIFIKKVMKKIIQTIFSFGLAVSMLAIAPLASANYSINSLPNDCKTVGIANRTTGQGSNNSCWASSVSATPGQEFVVGIYYNNSGTSSAQNVTLKLTDVRNRNVNGNDTVSLTGSVLVNGSVVKTESVSLQVASSTLSKIVYKNAAVYSNATGVNNPVSNGSDVFSGNGFSIGTLNPGTQNQGVFKIAFGVESINVGPINPDPNTFSQHPTVSTTNISGLQNATGTVTLNGYFNANGSSASSQFRYRLVGGSWITTPSQSHGNTSGNISRQVTGLGNGTYEYQACVTNSVSTKCGKYNSSIDDPNFVIQFTIANNLAPQCPSGTTWNGSVCVQNNPTPNCPSGTTWNGTVCIQNTSCPSGYHWSGSACVQNIVTCQTGYVKSGNTCVRIRCQTGYYLSGNTCVREVDPEPQAILPTVSTLGAVGIGSTVAVVDGYFSANGCQTTTRFEYGTTQNLGLVSSGMARINAQGSMVESISGLSPSTTYYYRAVAVNCVGVQYGAIRSFTTTARTVVNPGPVITGGTGNGSFIRLMITNNRDVVRQGREVAYDLAWENVSGRDLSNLVLEVNFPEQLIITETERGQITRSGNSVIYKIPSLARRESGEMTIYTEVRTGLREGDPVVAQAIMAFENPTTQATENAIAYDADEYSLVSGAGLGASLFGLGFFPTSLAGWLLILLIIILIVLAVRYFNRRNTVAVVNQVPAQAPYSGAPAQDYVVYRPNPKQ